MYHPPCSHLTQTSLTPPSNLLHASPTNVPDSLFTSPPHGEDVDFCRSPTSRHYCDPHAFPPPPSDTTSFGSTLMLHDPHIIPPAPVVLISWCDITGGAAPKARLHRIKKSHTSFSFFIFDPHVLTDRSDRAKRVCRGHTGLGFIENAPRQPEFCPECDVHLYGLTA